MVIFFDCPTALQLLGIFQVFLSMILSRVGSEYIGSITTYLSRYVYT